MSVEHSATIAYGLTLTSAQCRDALIAIGENAGTDPKLDDYVEEPFWNLALAIGLEHEITGDSYASDGERYVIGPLVVFDDDAAVVSCDPNGLSRLREFAARHFPNMAPGWVREMSVH